MKVLFSVSAENLKLSNQELEALFEIYDLDSKKQSKHKITIINSKKATKAKIKKLSNRSSMLKFSGKLISETSPKNLEKEFQKINWAFIKCPFCLRIKTENPKLKEKIPALERTLSSIIWKSLKKPSVDLENPITQITIIINKKAYITEKIWEFKTGRFKDRDPKQKPAFHPTSLKPKLSRLLVNLSRSKKSLLDPFCGAGSILIEASLLNIKTKGYDIDNRMIQKAFINLIHYKCKNFLLKKLDATKLHKELKSESVEAIATDPPYGQSAYVGAKDISTLYKEFLTSASKVLKKGSYIALIHPHKLKKNKFLTKSLKEISSHSLYVHGGLTRKILVLKKK